MPGIQVLARADAILTMVSRGQPTLADISRETGLHKATAYHILRTLGELGYVCQDERKRYSLGPRAVAIAEPLLRQHSVRRAAEQVALWLAGRLRETVHVAVLLRGERYVVARVESDQTVTVNSHQLEHRRVYDGCSGRVLLAGLDEAELREIVQRHGLPGASWPGVGTFAELQEALHQVREQGTIGLLTGDQQAQLLATPVLGPDGRTWAAISVSLPVVRFQGAHKEDVLLSLQEAAERMSAMLSLE